MTSPTYQLALATMTLMTVGCADQVATPAIVSPAPNANSAPAVTGQVRIEPLTADQLARILNVQVWTANYSGGPIGCWIEIEEEGQSTLPKRIPEAGFLGQDVGHRPSEGTIEFWWTRREDRTSGELYLRASNASYGYGLSKDSFTFAWPGFSARSTPTGTGKPIQAVPDKDFVIVDYDASEASEPKPGQARRRVHLKLIGRFLSQK